MPTGHLHLLCGLICSGKSTLSQKLAQQPNTLRISEDQWLKTLFGPDLQALSDYVTYSKRVQNLLASHVADLLATGVTVVLDAPANTPKQRAWLKALIETSGAAHTLHLLDTPLETCRTRLHARNASGTHEFHVSEEQFEMVSAHFSVPTPSEGFAVKIHAA